MAVARITSKGENSKKGEASAFEPSASIEVLGVAIAERAYTFLKRKKSGKKIRVPICKDEQDVVARLEKAGMKTLGDVKNWLDSKKPKEIAGIGLDQIETIKLALATLGCETSRLGV